MTPHLPEHCIIKDSPDQEGVCGGEVYTHLKTQYTSLFDDIAFQFPVCKEHYDAIIGNLNMGDFSAYRL